MAVYSVTEVTKYIKGIFQREELLQKLLVQGEVSNFKLYPSGHAYFTLKDQTASLKCVMFRSRAQYLKFKPENGLAVTAAGAISVYERDGAYQLYVDSLTPVGAGALALAFEQLKNRLSAEGLFSPEHKQKLPAFPEKIGVVTSPAGAVLRDIYNVTKRRWPKVRLALFPVQVQGDRAAGEIAAGIKFFNERYPVDVLIVGRGGGSLEDLWAFNEEAVVRAIYSSQIPIISAVGHETDFTLADFVSDVRAATPSQAAELAVPDRSELKRYVDSLAVGLKSLGRKNLERCRTRFLRLQQSALLARPQRLIAAKSQRADMAKMKLMDIAKAHLQAKKHRLEVTLRKLDTLNPARVMARGYGWLTDENGLTLRSVEQINTGDNFTVRLRDGKLRATVKGKILQVRDHAKEKNIF